MPEADRMALAAQIVSAHVSNNTVPTQDVPALIQAVFKALNEATAPQPELKSPPAVPIKQSLRNEAVICLDCGKSFSMLKRHLMTDHKLTTQQYRERWGLPRDYPMVAPDYAKTRSRLAKKIGLGRPRAATTPAKKMSARKA